MAQDLDKSMRAAKRALKKRAQPKPIYTPCCKEASTLKGQPAPQYHCHGCGKVYTSLAEFTKEAG